MPGFSSFLLMGSKQVLNQMLQKTWGWGKEARDQKDTEPKSEGFKVNYSKQSGGDNTQHTEDAKERQGCSYDGEKEAETWAVCALSLHIVLDSFASGCFSLNY